MRQTLQITPPTPRRKHGVIDIGDTGLAAAAAQKPQTDIASAASKINQLLMRLRCHPVNHRCFPQPVNATTHHIIHNVITIGNRIKYAAHHARFVGTLDGAKAKIYGIVITIRIARL